MTTYPDLYVAWVDLLDRLVNAPQYAIAPRGHGTRERLVESFTIEDLRANIIVSEARNVNHRFMVAEWLWIAFGRNDVETIAQYNARWREFSDDGVTFAGAYGPRVLDQLRYIIDKLREDPHTRQAVMTMWKPSPPPSKDIPCTISLQFLLRDEALHVIATMRSSDAWLGVPYDVFTFSMIANAIAGELRVAPGSLTMQLGSSHLYDEHLEAACRVLAESEGGDGYTLWSPALPAAPPFSLEPVLVRGTGSGPGDELWGAYADVLVDTRANALSHLERIER